MPIIKKIPSVVALVDGKIGMQFLDQKNKEAVSFSVDGSGKIIYSVIKKSGEKINGTSPKVRSLPSYVSSHLLSLIG